MSSDPSRDELYAARKAAIECLMSVHSLLELARCEHDDASTRAGHWLKLAVGALERRYRTADPLVASVSEYLKGVRATKDLPTNVICGATGKELVCETTAHSAVVSLAEVVLSQVLQAVDKGGYIDWVCAHVDRREPSPIDLDRVAATWQEVRDAVLKLRLEPKMLPKFESRVERESLLAMHRIKAASDARRDKTGEGGMTEVPKDPMATTKKRGRPVDSDPKADKRIFEAWMFGNFARKSELERRLGLKSGDVQRAIHRHRVRLARTKSL